MHMLVFSMQMRMACEVTDEATTIERKRLKASNKIHKQYTRVDALARTNGSIKSTFNIWKPA